MYKKNEPECIFKPTKEHLKRAKESLEEIRRIVKEKNIPYIPSEKMADLLKDRDLDENYN